MGDMAEIFQAMKEDRKEQKQNNLANAGRILETHGVKYRELTEYHWRVGEWDFWPSTGKFIHTKMKARGHGVFNLIKRIGGQ